MEPLCIAVDSEEQEMFEIFSTCLLQNLPCLFRETFFLIVLCLSVMSFFVYVIVGKAMLRKRTVLKRLDVKLSDFVSHNKWRWLQE